MQEEEVREALLQKSVLVPPIDIFENPGTREEVIERLVRRWSELAERRCISLSRAFMVLDRLLNSISPEKELIVFFGSSIYAPEGEQVNDIDVMRFIEKNTEWFHNPTSLNLQIFERHLWQPVFDGMRPAFANALLVYPADGRICELQTYIQLARRNLGKVLKELVIVALRKQIEERLPDISEDRKSSRRVIEYAQSIDMSELRKMSDQGLRRMRIKKEKIPRIPDRFIRHVKRTRCRC